MKDFRYFPQFGEKWVDNENLQNLLNGLGDNLTAQNDYERLLVARYILSRGLPSLASTLKNVSAPKIIVFYWSDLKNRNTANKLS